jgi:hypothetical protein
MPLVPCRTCHPVHGMPLMPSHSWHATPPISCKSRVLVITAVSLAGSISTEWCMPELCSVSWWQCQLAVSHSTLSDWHMLVIQSCVAGKAAMPVSHTMSNANQLASAELQLPCHAAQAMPFKPCRTCCQSRAVHRMSFTICR